MTAFDVVIVGARCAGASLGVYLRRAGLSVALLDASPLPSDQPMSTHLVQPPGMDELDALGVGDRVRALTPALSSGRFEFDGRAMTLRYGAGRSAHCLRRAALDGLLQQAAIDAGADLRPESRVIGLLRARDGRVAGVEVRRAGGGSDRLSARVVVGADGRHSTVARLVGAEEYLGYDGPRATYWAYWRRPTGWDPALFYNSFAADHSRVLFPADGDCVLIASAPPVETAAAWRGDHRAAYLADVRSFAPLADLLGADEPLDHVRGLLKTRYFFRAAAGAGWALAGDAGHHKEFVIGLGISDALRDARELAQAIVKDSDAALRRYWRKRDVERIEMFYWGRALARADRVTALERLVADRVAEAPEIAARFGPVIDGRMSPYQLFPPGRVVPWVAAAALRGEVGALGALGAVAADAVRVRIELGRRKRLLAATEHEVRATRACVGARAPQAPPGSAIAAAAARL